MAFTLPYKSYLTPEEFRASSGYDLYLVLQSDDGDNKSEIASRFLLECSGMIYKLIMKFTDKRWADLMFSTEALNDILAYAQYEQAVYVLENGGALSALNGDRGASGMVSLNEIRGVRNYFDGCIEYLTSYGILGGGGIC